MSFPQIARLLGLNETEDIDKIRSGITLIGEKFPALKDACSVLLKCDDVDVDLGMEIRDLKFDGFDTIEERIISSKIQICFIIMTMSGSGKSEREQKDAVRDVLSKIVDDEEVKEAIAFESESGGFSFKKLFSSKQKRLDLLNDVENMILAARKELGHFNLRFRDIDCSMVKLERMIGDNLFGVRALVLDLNSNRLICGNGDTNIKVLKLGTAEPEFQLLKGHSAAVLSLALDSESNTLYSGGGLLDCSIKMWNFETLKWKNLTSYAGRHTDVVNALVLDPTAKNLYSASLDKTIRVWDLVEHKCLHVLEGHTGGVGTLALDSCSSESTPTPILYSGSDDNTIRVWKRGQGEAEWECVKVMEGHEGHVQSIVLDTSVTIPDGKAKKYLYSAAFDKTIRVWDLEEGECIRVLKGHTGSVRALALDAGSNRLYSGATDNTIRVWDLEKARGAGGDGDNSGGVQVQVLEGHTRFINALALSTSTESKFALYSGSDGKNIRIWR